jgi:Mg-chelatase subunit ChlD
LQAPLPPAVHPPESFGRRAGRKRFDGKEDEHEPPLFQTFVVGVIMTSALLKTQAGPPPHEPPVKEPANPEKTLEMVFVLDTTGSMGGLIDGAKQRIWGIVNEVMQTPARPAVRVGLVAYRDRGDAYVTQVLPLTNDLDKVYTTLMEYRADGGGDGPEDVRRALADGVRRAGWSRPQSNTAQIVFLVGDAPPHDDYAQEPDTLDTAAEAIKAGMVVNTIQCGADETTRQVWQQIARRGEGQYFRIAQDGGVQTIATPYDSRLSELGGRLGATFLAYGGGSGEEGERFRADASERQVKTESAVAGAAPVVAQADRAVNKALNRDAYVGDLLQSIENGSVKLDDVKSEDLPVDLRKLSADGRKQEVERRHAHIAAERKKHSGTQTGFDAAVASALKEQLARKGIK